MIRKKKDEQKIHCNGSLQEINKKNGNNDGKIKL